MPIVKSNKPKILHLGHWDNFIPEFYDPTLNGGVPDANDGFWTSLNKQGNEIFSGSGWLEEPKFFPAAGKRIRSGWAGLTTVLGDRIQIVDDATAPNGKKVALIRVESGDHDVVHSGERAEIERMVESEGDELRPYESDGRQFVAFSVKLSSGWQTPTADNGNGATWGTCLQLHSPNYLSSSPAIDLGITDDFHLSTQAGSLEVVSASTDTHTINTTNKTLTIETGLNINQFQQVTLVADELNYLKGNVDSYNPSTGELVINSISETVGSGTFSSWGIFVRRDTDKHDFSDGSLKVGEWVQFFLDITWSYTDSGRIEIFRKNEGETEFTSVLARENVPTLQFSSLIPSPTDSNFYNSSHYWRCGFYRSTTLGDVTNELRLGSIIVGTDEKAVKEAAFEPGS